MKCNRNRAFTLVELLVSCLCLAILTAISLPALRSARDNANVKKCANQIREVCIAAHNYHDAYRRLPPATLGVKGVVEQTAWDLDEGKSSWTQQQNTSSLFSIAQFMEMRALFEQADPFAFNVSRDVTQYLDREGEQVHNNFWDIHGIQDIAGTTTAKLLCPEDTLIEEPPANVVIATQPLLLKDGANRDDDMGLKFGPVENPWAMGLTNYIANGGATGGATSRESEFEGQRRFIGPMLSRTKTTLETIADGTSNTLMYGETLGQIVDGKRTQAHCWSLGGMGRGRGDIPWGEKTHPNNEGRRILGDNNWASIYGFGSKHEAGVNFVLADGAVVNYAHTMDQEVLYALFGAKDGEIVEHQDFNQIFDLLED